MSVLKLRHSNRLKNQRGQSSVEYVLILALGVAIVLGSIYQLNSAFRVWSDSYFGDYLGCLLETGELPGLGGTTSGECQAKEFSIADGKPLVGGSAGNDSDGSKKDDETDPSDVKGDTATGTAAGNADSGNNQAGNNGRNKGTRTRIRRGGGGGASDEEGADSSSSSGSAFADGYDTNKTRTLVKYPEGYRGRRARQDEKENQRTKIKASADETRRPDEFGKLTKVRARSPTGVPDEPETPFSIGNLLRYLIIIIIIIAILVFIGGQALQVSKST